ncbi:MAG TPA: cobalt-precorrin-6A reductase [Halomicronema sp.]
MKKILILGGTGDAAELARRVTFLEGVEVISSLAGRTRKPGEVAGNVRVGGFGGEAGLKDFLQKETIDLVIDATHPFARSISFNAAAACVGCGVQHLMLIRPAWEKVEGDEWIEVESNEIAAQVLGGFKRVFLTIGRQELGVFSDLQDIWFLMRMIDPPAPEIRIPKGELLLDKGPFSLVSERELLVKYKIEVIVSKNSGGEATYAKIVTARELGLPVVMVKRPPVPVGDVVTDVNSAYLWILKKLNQA